MTKATFGQKLGYVATRVVVFVVNLLPEVVAYSLADGLGRLYFRLSKKRRAYALRMLRNAFPGRPDAELLGYGRRGTGSLFCVAIDLARAGRYIRNGTLRDRIGDERFRERAPKPYLGLTAHLGSWEVAALWIAMQEGRADVVVQMSRNPLISDYITRSRAQANLTIHPRRGGIRPLARTLDAGGVGMLAVDQHQRLRALRVPFFGEDAATERAAATLAVRRGYPLLLGCCVRVGRRFRFEMVRWGVLEPERTGDQEADILALAKRINRGVEELVLEFPDQYVWIHNRYRLPPADAEAAADAVEADVD